MNIQFGRDQGQGTDLGIIYRGAQSKLGECIYKALREMMSKVLERLSRIWLSIE